MGCNCIRAVHHLRKAWLKSAGMRLLIQLALHDGHLQSLLQPVGQVSGSLLGKDLGMAILLPYR